MNRIEFMEQLERLLSDIPDNDRQDAIAYYNGYFDEAGTENEASVIQELGNPGKVAGIIKADLRESGNESAEYTETGYSDGRNQPNMNTPTRRDRGYQEPKQKSRMPIAIVIILIVFASPILLGVGGGLIGGIFGLLAGIVGIVIAIVTSCAAFLFGGAASIVVGLVKMVVNPTTGLVLTGLGGVMLAVGLLCMILFAWLVVKWLPALFRWFVNLCHRILNRGEGGEKE